MPIIINDQYTKFVQFAQAQEDAVHSTTIARIDGAPGGEPGAQGLDGRNITAAENDKVGSLWRRNEDKQANNVARDLFRKSISDMFGGDIPQSVKNAMLLKDYDKGRPLTARRIMAVKAEVDKLLQQHAKFNAGIKEGFLSSDNFRDLPQDFSDAMTRQMDRFRSMFGEMAVPRSWNMSNIMKPYYMTQELTALCNTANAQGRDVTSDEVIGLYATLAFDRLIYKVVGAKIMPQIKTLAPQFQYSEQAIGSLFLQRNPAIHTEFNACANPDDVAALFERHEAELQTFISLAASSEIASVAVETKAKEKLAVALGLDVNLVNIQVDCDDLCSDARDLHARIVRGEEPGSTEPGYDLDAAYNRLVDDFVQKRVEVYRAVDSLDLPDSVKGRWKARYVSPKSIPDITPAQLFEVVSKIDAAKFKTAISGASHNEAAKGLDDVITAVMTEICRITDKPRFFVKKGFDEMSPIYGMLIVALESRDPELAQAIQRLRETAIKDLVSYCEDKKLSNVATLLNVIEMYGGTKKQLPVGNKMNFHKALEAKADAELDAHAITDGKLRQAAKDAVVARGLEFLENAKTLDQLSDFLSKDLKAIVDEKLAPVLAKRAEMFAKYSKDISPEALPILKNLVKVLNWSDAAAKDSEEYVKGYAEDLKTWCNIKPGSKDANGLESIFQRRMDGYLKHVLKPEQNMRYYNKDKFPGIFQTFLNDLNRTARYIVNGKPVEGKNLDQRIVPFKNVIKDPAKLKAVSVMINQQIFGEFTTSIANRIPLPGWTRDMEDEPINNIPGIEKFASRDIQVMGGFQLFDMGNMEFDITVSPDEKSVSVRAKTDYPIHAHILLPTTTIGTCTITQSFTIDFSGGEPAIKDLKVGQTLS